MTRCAGRTVLSIFERGVVIYFCAHIAQVVEHFLGKEEVTGSSPVVGTTKIFLFHRDKPGYFMSNLL